MERTHRRPDWFYKTGERPEGDDIYFENMARVIFLAGLSWGMINRKWPNFKKAFENFSIEKVAGFDDEDVKRLMADPSIVRNRRKITATIYNAREFQQIRENFGSFQVYLDSLDKSQNYAPAIKRLTKRFKHLGPTSARIFLYSVGEDVRRPVV